MHRKLGMKRGTSTDARKALVAASPVARPRMRAARNTRARATR